MAQCKTFRLTDKGDTLNCTDVKRVKQGKWKVQVAPLRGQPGYEEEGSFVNNSKEGVWRKYNLMGDLLAIENYKWGYKNGLCRYFTIAGIEHEESWLAMNPAKAYDTIQVQDIIDPDKYEQVIVKSEGRALKHGTWRFFNPQSGQLLRAEKYLLDEPYVPGESKKNATAKGAADTTAVKKTPAEKPKPKEVLDFEKKNAGKKVKVRDGRVG